MLAGLGLFLYGMRSMEEALRTLAGRSFKKFLRKQTKSTIKAVIGGTVVTALLQSSSMLTLLVMSFTGAGIIGLKSGIGMILGANLGTTFTGWLISIVGFKIGTEMVVLPLLAVGGLGTIFLQSSGFLNISRFIMGFGFMFLGLGFLKDGFYDFAIHADLSFLHDYPWPVFLLMGFILAAGIQSSSASIMIFLSSLAAGIITLPQAGLLAIGADLGTTISAIIGTINGNTIRKKTGWAQFYINMFSAILALLMLQPTIYIMEVILNIHDPLVALVAFHSTFNLAGILILIPFVGRFSRWLDARIAANSAGYADFLHAVSPQEPVSAIEALALETVRFVQVSIDTSRHFYRLQHETPGRSYGELKSYENELARYYLQIQQQSLNHAEANRLNLLISCIREAAFSVKGIKDIRHNLEELRSSGNDEKYAQFGRIAARQDHFYREILKLLPPPRKSSGY